MIVAQRQSLSVEQYTADLRCLVQPDDRSVAVRLLEARGAVVAAPLTSPVSIPAVPPTPLATGAPAGRTNRKTRANRRRTVSVCATLAT